MAKAKSVYVCQNCGVQSPKWIGKCNSCNEWNSFVEEIITRDTDKIKIPFQEQSKPKLLSEISNINEKRLDSRNKEFNRVLGGGIIPGSLILLGGEPGIGKSTLALQIALKLKDVKTLYVSGEESEQQLKLRANRLGSINKNLYILNETSIENVFIHTKELDPDIIIIDSIQTMVTESIESSPGSVSQVRECASSILKMAKKSSKPVILIGHINKEGNLAGPKVMEHIVDTVLIFEGDRNHMYRILRATKNRFGSTSEMGIYEMQNSGLREVENPSELLLSHSDEALSGIAVSASIEGIRPFLIETQALVSTAVYGTPQRSSTGFDMRRLGMLLAVLEKKAGFKLVSKDVFLNIAGGIKVNDTAIDLAVICAILSSNLDIPIDKGICFAGEVSLSGEIRPVNRIDQRIVEAEKLGFNKIYISKASRKGFDSKKFKIDTIYVNKVEEVFRSVFKK
ncbi:DNA repair protein RadA [Bacteroidota bacterium]